MTDHGKVNALLVAQTLGLTVHELAQALNRDATTLSEDPTSEGLQPQLQALNDLAFQLRDVFGSLETARMWLRAPNPVLDARSPISYLLRGDAAAIRKLLRMAATGMPT